MSTACDPRILAISSPGGHWAELVAICANVPNTVLYAKAGVGRPGRTARRAEAHRGALEAPYFIQDANKDEVGRLLLCLWDVIGVVRRTAPTLVVTTGAAPGFLACVVAAATGRRALFIDSLANADQLSLSAKLCRLCRIPVLTQWESLADGRRVRHEGSIIGELS